MLEISTLEAAACGIVPIKEWEGERKGDGEETLKRRLERDAGICGVAKDEIAC